MDVFLFRTLKIVFGRNPKILSKWQKVAHFLKLYNHSQKKNLLNFLVSEFCLELLSLICFVFQILAHYVRPIGKCWVVCCQRKVKVLALLTLITNSTVDRKLLSYHQLEENGANHYFTILTYILIGNLDFSMFVREENIFIILAVSSAMQSI